MPLLLPVVRDQYGLQRAMLILFPGLYVVSAALFSVSLCLLMAGDLCKKRRDEVKLKSPGQIKEASRQRRRRRVQARLSENSPLLQEVRDKNSSVQGRESGSSNSDSDDFIEIDEREQIEAQRALESGAAASSAGGSQKRPIITHPYRGAQGQGVGRGRGYGAVSTAGVRVGRGRGRGYGAVSTGVGRGRGRGRGYRAVTTGAGMGRGNGHGDESTAGVGVGRGYGAVSTGAGVANEQQRMSAPAPVIGSVSEWSVLSPSVEEKHWMAEMHEGI